MTSYLKADSTKSTDPEAVVSRMKKVSLETRNKLHFIDILMKVVFGITALVYFTNLGFSLYV